MYPEQVKQKQFITPRAENDNALPHRLEQKQAKEFFSNI
jgi:hypothetical protein